RRPASFSSGWLMNGGRSSKTAHNYRRRLSNRPIRNTDGRTAPERTRLEKSASGVYCVSPRIHLNWTHAGRGANYVRRKTQRRRFQEATPRRPAEDGPLSKLSQPDHSRTTRAFRL